MTQLNLALLDKLERYCLIKWENDRPNFSYYDPLEKQLVNGSDRLYTLTKEKLNRIVLEDCRNRGLHLLIAETEPIEFLAAFLAGAIAGVNLFLCDPHWQEREWQQVFNCVNFDLVFANPEIQTEINRFQLNFKRSLKKNFSQIGHSAIMIPTGGSSGEIKFTIHNWQTLSASARGFQTYFDCPEINSFCTLPLYHVSGLMQFMRSFLTRGEFIIYPYHALKKHQPILRVNNYFISLVPTQLQVLIEIIPGWLQKFKTVLLGGASIPQSLLQAARKYQIPLSPTYGMTETASGIGTLKPKDFLGGNNSNGLVLPHAEIIIAANNGEAGLIKIKADSLCLGYYPQLFPTPNVFITDDLGYFDPRGYLHLLGRNSQKIITGGENVFPAEVEAAILATKLVKDVCVIGTSDRHWGQAVTAIYVPRSAAIDLDSIQTKLKTQLANYKQPKHWLRVASLPRNDRGKLNYQQIYSLLVEKE